MDNELIKQQLALARVPREALSTTLVKEGHLVLREFILSGQFAVESMYLYPRQNTGGTNVYLAELAFSLMVKEMVLHGGKVVNVDLVEMCDIFFNDESEHTDLSARLRKCPVVAINGFHAAGSRATPFLTRYQEEFIASWVIRRMDAGVSFILLGGSPLVEVGNWWPARLVAKLKACARTYEVTR